MATSYRYLLFLCLICGMEGTYYSDLEKTAKKCQITRTQKLLAADCHRLDLTFVPEDLDTSIEVLDMSVNRLRELPCGAFDAYPYIKLLYLGDNLITNIGEGVFLLLQRLEVIDLSLNGLQKIPHELSTLPNMRKLYVDRNYFGDKGFDSMKEVENNFLVQFLSVASCGLHQLPPLHKFPELTVLNVSGNDIRMILPEDLAPACHLSLLDLNKNEHLFEGNDCQCELLDSYLREKKIRLVPPFQLSCGHPIFNHTLECGNSTSVSPETQNIYSTCKELKLIMLKESNIRKTWLIVGILALVIICIVMFGIFCFRRRYKRREQKRKSHAVQNNNLNRPGNPDGAESDQGNLLQDRGFNISNIQAM